MQSCLFCKIVAGEIPAKKVFEDEHVFSFTDINPQAPTHFLLIPKKHIATLNDVSVDDKELLGHMMLTASHLAKEQHISDAGFRIVTNCNQNGGQSVFHIHMHILGGRALAWPPG